MSLPHSHSIGAGGFDVPHAIIEDEYVGTERGIVAADQPAQLGVAVRGGQQAAGRVGVRDVYPTTAANQAANIILQCVKDKMKN